MGRLERKKEKSLQVFPLENSFLGWRKKNKRNIELENYYYYFY